MMSPESERLRNLYIYCVAYHIELILSNTGLNTTSLPANTSTTLNGSSAQRLFAVRTTGMGSGGADSLENAEPRGHGGNVSSRELSMDVPDAFMGAILNTTEQIVTPTICAFGVVGNILTLIFFSKRIFGNRCSSVEKGCLITLSSLSVSDLCFCLITCLGSLVRTQGLIFTSYDFGYWYQVYGGYFQNVFIKCSTWLTVIAGVSRYAIVCYPIWARMHVTRLVYIKVTVCAAFLVGFLLHIPLLWTHESHVLQCGAGGDDSDNLSLIVLDTGYFRQHERYWQAFTYTWAIVGYFVPVTVLGFCNIRLILAYRKSQQFRQQYSAPPPHPHPHPHGRESPASSHDRITVTLIIIILFFILLMSPSEILHFCHDAHVAVDAATFSVAVALTNVLQAINFSANFVLYSMMNVYVRRSFSRCFTCRCTKASHVTNRSHASLRSTFSKNTMQSLV